MFLISKKIFMNQSRKSYKMVYIYSLYMIYNIFIYIQIQFQIQIKQIELYL